MVSTGSATQDAQDAPAEEYAGPAVVSAGVSTGSTSGQTGSSSGTEDEIAVEVHLRGHFEPIDGKFHWFGRIATSDELAARHQAGATVTLTTPQGTATGRLSDVDPWGRFRITGTGRPPF